LRAPDPSTTSDRLGLFLRTTREKELERRFNDERHKRIQPGATRRNLSRATKEHLARNLQPTTIFDLFWRLRTKANYDDADAFVLGAAGMADARAFGDSIAIVTDATVGAPEGLMLAHVGPDPYGELGGAIQASHQLCSRFADWSACSSLRHLLPLNNG
jgi:hypothetical protein